MSHSGLVIHNISRWPSACRIAVHLWWSPWFFFKLKQLVLDWTWNHPCHNPHIPRYSCSMLFTYHETIIFDYVSPISSHDPRCWLPLIGARRFIGHTGTATISCPRVLRRIRCGACGSAATGATTAAWKGPSWPSDLDGRGKGMMSWWVDAVQVEYPMIIDRYSICYIYRRLIWYIYIYICMYM